MQSAALAFALRYTPHRKPVRCRSAVPFDVTLTDAARKVVKGGLVRITLQHAFSDSTVAIGLDPLSLLSRLAALVLYPRVQTVRYADVLAAAVSCASDRAASPIARIRYRFGPSHMDAYCTYAHACRRAAKRGPPRPRAELMHWIFLFDVLHRAESQSSTRLLAVVIEGDGVRRDPRATDWLASRPLQICRQM